MRIHYETAEDVKELVDEIIKAIEFVHIDDDRVLCMRSKGSKAKRTIARIHGLPRIWQLALTTSTYYTIEVISENFDSLSIEEKEKTIIHELLHIPKGFRGGFRHHKGWINRRKIDGLHRLLIEKRRQEKDQPIVSIKPIPKGQARLN
ncbi:MAG: hypothetical protein QG670_1051 [Thermoproteota archaeon]|nr:hypothetical protein [Thermoproteota archaeon]